MGIVFTKAKKKSSIMLSKKSDQQTHFPSICKIWMAEPS